MATQLIDLSQLDSYSEEELFSWLSMCDDLYENDPDSLVVTDEAYDSVRRYCEVTYPANKYLIGVGSTVRGGKIKLAYAMTGLVQRQVGELQSWLDVVGDRGNVVVSDKLDGTSAQIIYDGAGHLQKGFSRGDGIEAADITRHLRLIPSVPKNIPNTSGTFPVRAEMIISKQNWEVFKNKFKKRDGSAYKNARAAISSIMNSSTNDPDVYQYIDCVAFTIIDSKLNKVQQFETLSSMGFLVPKYKLISCSQTEQFFADYIPYIKQLSEYELDGIVLNADNDNTLEIFRNNGMPNAIKYKVVDETNVTIATVKQVVWTASKSGFAKPRVEIHPTDLCGVTISFATGFNAKFIKDNGIGPGAKVKITRSGDVIPYIMQTVYSVQPQLPDPDTFGQWQWSDTGVDAILIDTSSNSDVLLNSLVDTFTKLKIAHLKDGNIQALIDAGYNTIESIITMDYVDMYMLLGENGKKIYASIEERLHGIYWPDFVGSLNMLGRGIGIRKITAAYNHFSGDIECLKNVDMLLTIPGFESATAKPIAENINSVLELIYRLTVSGKLTITEYTAPTQPSGTKFANKGLVFSGFRDPQLEQMVIDEGGTIKSGISSAVHILVCKDTASSSGKAKKAREMGIEIIDVRELQRRLL